MPLHLHLPINTSIPAGLVKYFLQSTLSTLGDSFYTKKKRLNNDLLVQI